MIRSNYHRNTVTCRSHPAPPTHRRCKKHAAAVQPRQSPAGCTTAFAITWAYTRVCGGSGSPRYSGQRGQPPTHRQPCTLSPAPRHRCLHRQATAPPRACDHLWWRWHDRAWRYRRHGHRQYAVLDRYRSIPLDRLGALS